MIQKSRKTKETDISIELEIYGTGKHDIDTGIGFFDHMLSSFAKHSLFDLKIKANGDLNVDFHHTVEDVGILLGECLKDSIYPLNGVERFGDSIITMDEAAISIAIDLCNRFYLVYESIDSGKVGDFDIELVCEFFRSFSLNASINLHIVKLRGSNSHHIIEASFKAVGVALRRALVKNSRVEIPSTKGVL
ncbi:MAG: imidazoleglycerol-phosphate dehydratase HisB [Campylobacter sputorum]|uniref:imidazoleglycerol-phosphate dehydratase HisB n=1 Tax=Campylobacter sputorum TaxID=206 RepID=UPI0019113D39|nr:imidazoleglycerol-phosphate dehydratase HisB [Campylobacter sputorum]ASM39070.1 imidazoleglycerol-phosphate dehydratase [Campylobacter sputorum bv. paraureolyticus LMG 11764]MDY6120375.1 imidazoleglycerol-phosphate dehydratase HisB [Campylobacter sputorum]